MRWRRDSPPIGVTCVAEIACACFLIVAACGSTPSLTPPTTHPATSPSPTETPGPSTGGPTFQRVEDASGVLPNASGVVPTVVAIPGGGFLLLLRPDSPSGGRVLRSDDGRTWASVPIENVPPVRRLFAMAASPKVIVVLCEEGPEDASRVTAWQAADGRSWARAVDGGALGRIGAGAIAGSQDGFVVSGFGGIVVAIASPDATQWNTVSLPIDGSAGSEVSALGSTNDGFAAVGAERRGNGQWPGVAWRAIDGIWTQALHAGASLNSVSWLHGHGLAVGTTTVPDPSTDDGESTIVVGFETLDGGQTWNPPTTPFAAYLRLDTWVIPNGLLVAGAPPGPRQPAALWLSDSDATWSQLAADLAVPGDVARLTSVAFDERHIVVVGTTFGTGGGGSEVLAWVADR